MKRQIQRVGVAALLSALFPARAAAVTREIAELSPARLTFEQSVLNQLTYGTYRDPFDELQTRPYNLLFSNIGRHPNLSPWQGQQGSYTRYFNGLIGNNGTANVDNDADSIQGALIRRETPALSWGVSAAYLAGNVESHDTNGSASFESGDDLEGYELRGAASLQLSERQVLGTGIRLTSATHTLTDNSFEPGVGGFFGTQEFDQQALSLDGGIRHFLSPTSSFEGLLVLGVGSASQEDAGQDLDATGAVTDRLVTRNYDLSQRSIGIWGGYNRARLEKLGETEYRGGLVRSERRLDDDALAFRESGGTTTPSLTLLGQEPITETRLVFTARTIFQAGETEMFLGADLDFGKVEGATRVDAAGTVVNESVDDSLTHGGLTVGLRQPMLRDKLRFIISGRADLLRSKRDTTFDSASTSDDSSRSTAQYAIGLEGSLANVTFDIAWLVGEEAPVTPVPLGLPQGSRRTVALDRLVFSAAVAW